MQILVAQGNIITQRVEAIVTAANVGLRGGGVDGAVHHAAGPELLRARREIAPCPTGSAVVTPAFDLAPVRWVIHAVGPVYRRTVDDAGLLQSAYTSSLARADEVGAASVAFPSISTGVYGYPGGAAASLSVQALRTAHTQVETVLLVAFTEEMAGLWDAALSPH